MERNAQLVLVQNIKEIHDGDDDEVTWASFRARGLHVGRVVRVAAPSPACCQDDDRQQ